MKENARRGEAFREFLNRLDDVIVFRQLTKPDLVTILDLEVTKVMERLKHQNITLVLDEGEGLPRGEGLRPAIRRARCAAAWVSRDRSPRSSCAAV